VNPETLRDKIADYVAGHLDESDARAVRAFLLTDASAREFHDRVARLYRLDLDPAIDPPAELRPFEGGPKAETGAGARVSDPSGRSRSTRRGDGVPRTSPSRTGFSRRVAIAAAVLILVTAGFAALRGTGFFGGGSADRRGAPIDVDGGLADRGAPSGPEAGVDSSIESTEFSPLPLLPIAIERPELPASYRDGEWLHSRDQALLVSKYSGRPLLESYINPDCPVSRAVQKTMCSSHCRKSLSGFVCYEESYEGGEVPEPVRDQVDASEIVYRLPAVRVSGGGCEAETRWGVRDFEEVEDELRSYSRRCEESGTDMPSPLPTEEYERNLAALQEALRLFDEESYGPALASLAVVLESESGRKTAFGPTAHRLERQILDGIERQVEAIEEHAEGAGPIERAQARDLAERFAARLASDDASSGDSPGRDSGDDDRLDRYRGRLAVILRG
jgi:hypothetical protein